MTGWAELAEPALLAESGIGWGVQVTWVDPQRHWAVWISRQFQNALGNWESDTVYTGHFGPEECPTGYQALMLGLSDYRTRR